MLALVDLYLCIHRILLHYLIKICVIIFLHIFCKNIVVTCYAPPPENPLESPWTTLTFVTSSVNLQSPKISQTMDNGMFLPLSRALAHNSWLISDSSNCYCDWTCVSWYCVKYVMLLCASAQLRGRDIPLSIVWLILGDWWLTDEVTKVKVGQGDSWGFFWRRGLAGNNKLLQKISKNIMTHIWSK